MLSLVWLLLEFSDPHVVLIVDHIHIVGIVTEEVLALLSSGVGCLGSGGRQTILGDHLKDMHLGIYISFPSLYALRNGENLSHSAD